MTWSKTRPVLRLALACVALLVVAAEARPFPRPVESSFTNVIVGAKGDILLMSGVVTAPPGCRIIVTGLPGHSSVELQLGADGTFSGSFPVPPGASGSLQFNLIDPSGELLDTYISHFE
ncbi:MAG TPA: hypothetical protein PKD86_00870 [Gemmatales bacterium]|nr:hypothetical protein [Gemmatales bacterium]HMP57875.1 hypothetical protein [Gemmatales bacterium]